MKTKHKGDPRPGAIISDQFGKLVCMAISDNYVMCRRPGSVPFVMPLQQWISIANAETKQK